MTSHIIFIILRRAHITIPAGLSPDVSDLSYGLCCPGFNQAIPSLVGSRDPRVRLCLYPVYLSVTPI